MRRTGLASGLVAAGLLGGLSGGMPPLGAEAGETAARARFVAGTLEGSARSETAPLALALARHLSSAALDDDSQQGSEDVARVAADGPLLSYSLVIDIDQAETQVLSPFGNLSEHAVLLNSIAANQDFSGITSFQQTAGSASASSNLVLSIEGEALDRLIEELFGPDETLLETTASAFVGEAGTSQGQVPELDASLATAGARRIVGGASASRTTHSTLAVMFDLAADAGALVELSSPVTRVLSPHGNVARSGALVNAIVANEGFSGITTFQQQAGHANAQSNLVVRLRSLPALPAAPAP